MKIALVNTLEDDGESDDEFKKFPEVVEDTVVKIKSPEKDDSPEEAPKIIDDFDI